MDSNQRNKLLQKRTQLQLQLRFNDFVKACVEPFTEVLEELQRLEINHGIVSLRFVPLQFEPLLVEKFRSGTFAKFDLSGVDIAMEDKRMEQIMDVFPNKHSSRYFPDLPVVGSLGNSTSVLKELIEADYIAEQHVYVCWLQYSFLLEVDIRELAQRANKEILDSWHGDVIIFSKDFSWLAVYYAFEDEWRFGKDYRESYPEYK
jgi:hypothetical protein